MRAVDRRIYLVSAVMFLAVLVSGCEKAAADQASESVLFSSFRAIPGVTEAEINAIEALREQVNHFRYGIILSTESYYDDNGVIRGFSALFCEWLTDLFGIPFIPENTEFADLLEKLASKEIDFTGALTATEERRETFIMTSAIGLNMIQYFRIIDSMPLEILAESRPLRYSFMEGTTTIDLVTSMLTPGTYEIILSNDIDEVYRMLKSGAIDAHFTVNKENNFDVYGDVIARDFFPLIYTTSMLMTQNPALEPIISVIQKALDNGALQYLAELHNTGYQEYLKHKLSMRLSDEERRYIEEHPVVPFAAGAGNYPGSFYNEYEKEWQGFAFDALREVEALTDLRFELVNNENDDWFVILEMLEDGKASMVTELMYSKEREGSFLWSDTILMENRPTLISASDFRNISLNEILYLRVGLIKDYVYSDLFMEWFPDHSNTTEYNNISAAIDALGRGEIDVVMTITNELMSFTHFQERTDYKINYLFDSPLSFSFGYNRNEALLCSIVDKALLLIDTNRITDQWMHKTYNYRSRIVQAQLPWLIGSSVLFLFVLALVVVLFVRNRRVGKRMERLVGERTQDLALQTSLLTTIFDSIPDIVFCKDIYLRYTQCNRATEDVNDIKEADFIGKTDIEISKHPADIARKIMEADRATFREGRRTVTEELIPFRDGSMRTLETIRAPLVQDGVIIGLVTIARDITQRKNVERELELQTTTLTTLFDSIPDLIFTMDKSLRFTQCNISFTKHFGLNKEDIINKGEDHLGISAEMAEEHNNWNRKVIEESQTVVLEERIPRVDGMNALYETVKAPLILNGAVVGVLCIAHNITERKEMEEAALAASRSKSVFLANMSHEIRTPMNSIMGFSELALDGETFPKTREYLIKIQSNAEWLLQIINDILDISKIESGKMELENIPFDMHELFENCRTLIIPKAVEKGIILQFYTEPSIGKRPLGDPTRLRQVLVNLLSNAVKFTNSGTVKVLTEIKEKSEKTATFHFEIKDSGIGMTKEQIERIFDPFTQAETGTTRKYGGTGLGLTISKNLIELMGGKLAVESTPGVGSKFSFDLTFDTVDINDYEKFGRKALLSEIEKPIFNGEVLLCEDNLMNQQVISEHLARVGLRAVVAENGKAGVEKVLGRKEKGEKQFDLILMDIHMPVMDGLEAAGKIMGLDTGVPIVAMTANIMSSDLETYRMSGMHDCIGKPFTSQELWRCLLKYLTPLSRERVEQNKLRMSGPIEDDRKFQRELNLLFMKDNRGRYEEIVKALEGGDIRLANRLAHSLKTNAGQIGERSLQQTAGEVEKMLKEGKKPVTMEQLKKLETELALVLEKLEPLSEEAAVQAEVTQALAPEELEELFEKLEPLLKEGNLRSLDYIDDLRGMAGCGELIRQMEDFDFESAITTFAELRKRFEAG